MNTGFRTTALKFVLFLTFFLLGAFSSAETKVVRVSYPSPNAFYLPFFVGVERGLYQKHRLEVELIRIRGMPTAVQALIAGDVTFALGSPITGIPAIEGGAPLVMIMGVINEPHHDVFAVPDIQSLKDLRGRSVASGAPGSLPDFVIRTALSSAGLSPKDVSMVHIAGLDTRLAALRNRSVIASPLAPPFTYTAEDMGFKRLVSLKELITELQGNVVFVNKRTIENDPRLVQTFVSATLESIRYAKSNKLDSLGIFMNYAREENRRTAQRVVEEIIPSMPDDGRFTFKGIQVILEYLAEGGLLRSKEPSVNKYIDTRFVIGNRR